MSIIQAIEATTPFTHVSAAGLRLSLEDGARMGFAPGQVQARVEVVGLVIEPVVFGASHQIRVSGPEFDFIETVAPGERGDPMPTETTHRVGAFDYRFGSEIRMYRSPSSFARTVSDIRLRCQQESVESVVVCAPEMPAALTAIAVEPLTPAWTTWHAYPGTSEIVRTWSSLTPAS